jgi:hypothetical protein
MSSIHSGENSIGSILEAKFDFGGSKGQHSVDVMLLCKIWSGFKRDTNVSRRCARICREHQV